MHTWPTIDNAKFEALSSESLTSQHHVGHTRTRQNGLWRLKCSIHPNAYLFCVSWCFRPKWRFSFFGPSPLFPHPLSSHQKALKGLNWTCCQIWGPVAHSVDQHQVVHTQIRQLEIWPQRPRCFAAAIAMHYAVGRWHVSVGSGTSVGGGGWHISGG